MASRELEAVTEPPDIATSLNPLMPSSAALTVTLPPAMTSPSAELIASLLFPVTLSEPLPAMLRSLAEPMADDGASPEVST